MKQESLPLQHSFGGGWTTTKLNRLEQYLDLYTKALKNQPFKTVYMDAFAGTGYRTRVYDSAPSFDFLEEWFGITPLNRRPSLDGSARLALQITNPFSRYVFIEKNVARFRELEKLRGEFPALAGQIELRNNDAIAEIGSLCSENWSGQRGVMFLDPYGMQVPWTTMQAIGRTKAIDVWILVPLGIGVNRLLPRNGRIAAANRARLDTFFGATDWYDIFYSTSKYHSVIDDSIVKQVYKAADLQDITSYYMNRLRECFAGVADHPLWLNNSKGVPLFLLCFAMGNPKPAARNLALKFASHILK